MSIAQDDSINFSSSGVGDDEGNREYPFITNPKVLEINRKLNEYHRKLLFQDFVSSVTSQDYDNCPKGSIMSSQLKPSVPGPYFSCPFLHESGDDFFPLPFITKRGAMRPRLPLPISRRSKRFIVQDGLLTNENSRQFVFRKRPQCRKCQVIAFNHYDSNCYHEHYLKYSTYSKIRTSQVIFSRGVKARPKFEDEDEGSREAISSPNSAALSDIKDLIDPKKPYLLEDPAKSGKRRRGKSSSNRVSIQSRYHQSLSARKSRLDPMSSDVRCRAVAQDEAEESPRNPFPMPDLFEEVYFGSMPESFSTLPLALQNFKKTQMKMAGDTGRQAVDPGQPKQTAKPVDLFPRLNRPGTSVKPLKPVTPVAPPPPDKSGSTKSTVLKFKGLRKISSPINLTKRRSLVLPTSSRPHKLQSSSWPTVSKRKSNASLTAIANKTRKRRGKLVQRPTTGAPKDIPFLSLLPKVNGNDYRKSVIKYTENQENSSSTPHGDSSRSQKPFDDTPKRAENSDGRASTPLAITVYKSVTELGTTELEWTGKSEVQLQNGNTKGRQERRKKARARPKTVGRTSTAKGIDDAISRRRMVMTSRGRHL